MKAYTNNLMDQNYDINRLSCKNATRYVSVMLDGYITRRICRFWFKGKDKSITVMVKDKKPIKEDDE